MIANLRMASQQLANPLFDDPHKLVTWMGALQAQDYKMVKWALGIRLKSANLPTIENALRKGEILRTHIMRPTWHLVAAEDIRWMLKLSAQRIKQANDSFAKGQQIDITEALYTRSNRLLEKILEGNNHLTKQEIGQEFSKAGIASDTPYMNRFMVRAEIEGIICSGIDKGNKPTYALLDERVSPLPALHKDEALACLATRYFRSHSPASLQDFAWWSGLPVTEAKQAIRFIETELIADRFASQNLYIHSSCQDCPSTDIFHFLPAYDEYLISYKDRTASLLPEHSDKAYTNYGLFFPIILHNGRIIGNWNRKASGKGFTIKTSFFTNEPVIPQSLIQLAEAKYKQFIQRE